MKDKQLKDAAMAQKGRTVPVHKSGLGWISYLALCAVGLIIGLTSLGPSASEGLGTLNKMVFWSAHVIPALILLASTQIAVGQVERVSALPGLAQVFLSATVAALLFAPYALALDELFGGDASLDDKDGPLWLRLAFELGNFFIPLVLIWTLINAPSLLKLESGGSRPSEKDQPNIESDSQDDLAEFWSRIPGRLGRRLVALSAELHYLRVYTTEGNALILFPFGRAVDLLQEQNGMQVHRSHWVALNQIDEVVSQDGRVFCQMNGGLALPVSRSYRSALKAARREAT
jgi:hypothetical protein